MGRLRFFESKKADDMSFIIHSRSQNTNNQPINKKHQIKEAKIEKFTELIDKGRIDVGDFLEAMASDDNRTYTSNSLNLKNTHVQQ